MDDEFCKLVRLLELKKIIHLFDNHLKVLEIGAGAGWQAQYLSDYAKEIYAIDIRENRYKTESVWPVLIYDGKRLPFKDNAFDIVFSSNVLEHVDSLETLLPEIRRVLTSSGTAIHILPSATWRFWTSITHYPAIIKQLFKRSSSNKTAHVNHSHLSHVMRRGLSKTIFKAIWPERHGTVGNSISELFYFSRFSWHSRFNRYGWEIISLTPNGLFYTRNTLLASKMGVAVRMKLSTFLGSATVAYVVK